MKEYDIWFESSVIGRATVQEKGLYTLFCCNCNLIDKSVYRVIAAYADKELDLGICIPEGDHYVVKMNIPTKQLGVGVPRFYVKGKEQKKVEFVPLSQECRFPYLHKLDKAMFVIQNGEPGIVFDLPNS